LQSLDLDLSLARRLAVASAHIFCIFEEVNPSLGSVPCSGNVVVQNSGFPFPKVFDAMLETMRQKYNVDDQRIYATGFSNGAVFSYLLWAERGKTIAAIGEVAGRLWQTEKLKKRRPILAITGTADTTDPFICQFASIETAKQFDNATASNEPCPAPNEADPAAPSPKCTLYPSTTHTPVKTFIHDGEHHYPKWAPDEIVTFFKSHKLS